MGKLYQTGSQDSVEVESPLTKCLEKNLFFSLGLFRGKNYRIAKGSCEKGLVRESRRQYSNVLLGKSLTMTLFYAEASLKEAEAQNNH